VCIESAQNYSQIESHLENYYERMMKQIIATAKEKAIYKAKEYNQSIAKEGFFAEENYVNFTTQAQRKEIELVKKIKGDQKEIDRIFKPNIDFALTGSINSFNPNFIRFSLKPCDQSQWDDSDGAPEVVCEKDEKKILDYFRSNAVTFSWFDQYITTDEKSEVDSAGE
jgi:hypothetical protein